MAEPKENLLASSLEGQLYEIALTLLAKQRTLSVNSEIENIKIEYDLEEKQILITAKLPASFTLGGSNQWITVEAKTYIPDGTPSSLTI